MAEQLYVFTAHVSGKGTDVALSILSTIDKATSLPLPEVVVNRFPEHQGVFNGSKLVPGELSYTSAVKSTWLNSGKQNRVIIFGDSIFRGIPFREFNNEIKNGFAKFKTFPGADSKEILHYVNPTLQSGNMTQLFFILELITYCRKDLVSQIQFLFRRLCEIKEFPNRF